MIHILKFVCETLLICFACVELSGPDHSPFRNSLTDLQNQSLPRIVGPCTLSNLCQRLKSSLPLF